MGDEEEGNDAYSAHSSAANTEGVDASKKTGMPMIGIYCGAGAAFIQFCVGVWLFMNRNNAQQADDLPALWANDEEFAQGGVINVQNLEMAR